MKIKHFLNISWKEFVYGGHLVSLTAFTVILTIVILLEKKISWPLLLIGYLLVFINYRYNYHKGRQKDYLTNPERANYLKKYAKLSQILIVFSFLFLIFFLTPFLNSKTVLFVLFLLVIGLCYTLWIKEFTKKFIGLKNIYISLSWALFAVLTGAYYSNFSLALLLIFIFIFLKGILNTIFFDIKDIESDKKEGLKTLPVVLGKGKTIKFLHIFNFFSFLPLIMGVCLNLLPGFSLIMLVFFFFVLYYLEKAKDKNINIQKLSYLVADGEFLLWPIVLILGKSILSIL